MAALLLPLAFAGAGYLGFGSIGASVGWLIGAWLFGPKANVENQIFDPGAQEMPRFNQSLRGVTIPVLFGTNRVASNVVWVNNFQTIRKETTQAQQGGGKGGGSGGGGKGGGQATQTQVTYEYKWDILFHMGMGPEPYGLFGGWVNTQRMSGDTLLAIINDATGLPSITNRDPDKITFTVGGNTSQATQTKNTASLTFDDSYFGSGGPTGDNGYEPWDYFQAQVGQPARWPYTYYIGFKSLSLGSNPAVPQLSWEIGPGAATVTRTPTYLSKTSTYDNYQGTNSVMVGGNGKHYVLLKPATTNNLNVFCLETGVLSTILVTDLPGATDAVSSFFAGGGSPYFLFVRYTFSGADVIVNANLYKIDASGNFIVADSVSNWTLPSGQSLALNLSSPFGFCFMSFDEVESQSSGYLAWALAYNLSGTRKVLLLTWRYQGTVAEGAVIYPSLPTIAVTEVDNPEGIGFTPHGMRYSSAQRAFFLPEYHPENNPAVINGTWPMEYWMCFYINKAMIAADDGTSAVVAANKAAYPNGFVVGYKIQGKSAPAIALSIGGPEIINGLFKDENEQTLTKLFDDSGLAADDVTADQNSDYLSPTTVVTNEGGIILLWPKVFDLFADQQDHGYNKVKVFVWNPSEKLAKFYTESEGNWFDVIVDIGVGGGTRCTPNRLEFFYDLAQGQLYVVGNYGAAESVSQRTIASIWGPMEVGGGADVLVPYIIYQLLTNAVFGMGVPTGNVNQDSYAAALAFCHTNNYRVSVQYLREGDILASIEELLALYGGYLIDSGGQIRFGLVTTESSLNPVRVIDNHHLIPPKEGDPPVNVIKGAIQDGYNKVRVNYYDRALDYRQNQYEIGDEADQDINGVRFKELPPKFVMKIDMAASVAERALWTNLYARDLYQFTLGWKDADLEPGDVVTLVDSFHPELSTGKNVRIAHWQEKKRGRFDVTAVVEVPYYMSASHSVTNASSNGGTHGRNDNVLPCSDFRMYELPREFQTSGAMLFTGYNQQSNIRGATLWLSPDDVTYSVAQNAEPYIISGMFARPLPALSPGNCDRDVEVWIMPASGFSTATPTFCQTLALDDVTAAARGAGAGVLIAGSEALAMENLTLLDQNRYRIGRLYRGWGGTLPQAHSSGDLWHKHGSGVLAQEINTDKIGTNIYYKVVPYNFAGEAYDVSSITGKLYNIRGAYWLPQQMPGLATFVQSQISGTASTDLAGNVYAAVTSGGCDVIFDWPDCARLEGYGTSGFGKSTFGHFAADLDSKRWRVEVMSGGSVVRSVSVTSGPYTYTRVQNSADFAGFGGVFQMRVTPYNQYGDAPISTVKSLNLFW